MQKQVVYFCFQNIEKKPPCLSEVLQLRDRGYHVVLVTPDYGQDYLNRIREMGVDCMPYTLYKSRNLFLQKARNYFSYKKLWDKVRNEIWNDDTILWVGTEESLMKHRHFLKNFHPLVANALEYYEDEWWTSRIPEFRKMVDIWTACEPHRAILMERQWGLGKLPHVLRNKPYDHPRQRCMNPSTPEMEGLIQQIRGKKTLLYQGAIVADRDLSTLADILKRADSDFYLTLSGPVEGDALQKVRDRYDKVIYLGNIPYAYFLEVTSYAHIAVAFYNDTSLNNRYCAPNKIYEYSGFGIPMLCNDIPGLTSTVGESGAGICVDFSDPDAVIRALHEMDSEYDRFSRNAMRFYDDTDNGSAMDAILKNAFLLTQSSVRNRSSHSK